MAETPGAPDVPQTGPVPDRYPALLGVACDGYDNTGTHYDDDCDARLEADILVADTDPRDTRLGYILDHATAHGWTVVGRDRPTSALTFCPTHGHLAP